MFDFEPLCELIPWFNRHISVCINMEENRRYNHCQQRAPCLHKLINQMVVLSVALIADSCPFNQACGQFLKILLKLSCVHQFIYCLMAAFIVWWRTWVAGAESFWHSKPKIFSNLTFCKLEKRPCSLQIRACQSFD